MLKFSTTVLLLLFFTINLSAQTIYVRQGATGDGTSWDSAFGQLSAALQDASAGDTLLISAGTYFPTTSNDRSATFFLPDNVYLQGGFPAEGTPDLSASDPVAYPTILSGNIGDSNLATDNSFHVVTILNVTTSTTIRGLTITDGYADIDSETDQHGGGIFFQPLTESTQDGLQIIDCQLQNNYAANGGAICAVADSVATQILLRNCQFSNNEAKFGAAIYSEARKTGSLEFGVRQSSFTANNSTEAGGAIANYADGGNILFATVASAFIENVGVLGGAIYNFPFGANLTADIENCIFSNNIGESGGAIENFAFDGDRLQLNVRSCTFAGNRAEVGAALSLFGGGINLQATNTILWDNVASDEGNSLSSQFDAVASLQNCLIEEEDCNGISFNNTICRDLIFATDPLFQDAENNNLNLSPCSPAVDMGILSTGGTDFTGQPRIVGGLIDIGAYEVQQLGVDTILYVNASNTNITQDGTSWETAFSDLQSALSLIEECGTATEIWLTAGTYYPTTTDDRSASFQINSDLKILGQFAGTESSADERDFTIDATILSGNIGEVANEMDNSERILQISANTFLENITIQDAYGSNDGAGVLVNGNDTTTISLLRCQIVNNTTQANGGGIALQAGNLIIENCTIQGNEANNLGGGMYRTAGSSLAVRNTFWLENSANSGGAIYQVGNAENPLILPLVNCILAQNSASENGGALYNSSANATLLHCTVADNQAPNGAAIYNTFTSDLTQTNINTIFSNNTGESEFVFAEQAQGIFDHCLLSDMADCPEQSECAEVIFNRAPLFMTAAIIPYSILACSPAKNNANTEFATPTDILGENRMTADMAADIGALEGGIFSAGVIEVEGSTINTCFGDTTGEIVITPSENLTFPIAVIIATDTFEVEAFANSFMFDGFDAGGYAIEIIDGMGCSYAAQTVVEQIELDFSSEISLVNSISCANACDASILVEVNGSGDYVFEWEDGVVGSERTDLCAGEYVVLITDENSCFIRDTIQIVQLEPTELDFSSEVNLVSSVSCADACDASIVAEVNGFGNYTFEWNDGGVGRERSNLCAGEYVVLITNENSCFISDTIQITEPEPIDIQLIVENATNAETADGSIEMTATGGTGNYDFSWDNGIGNVQNPTGLAVGTYTLTVTDENGCVATQTVEIFGTGTALVFQNISTTNVRCTGENNGSINVMVSGGEGNITFAWTPLAADTNVLENIAAGEYALTITDELGMQRDTTIIINEPAPLGIFVNDVQQINCAQTCDGAIDLTIENGIAPLTVSWSNGANSMALNDLCAGNYAATLTDANGCVATIDAVELITPDTLFIEVLTFNDTGVGDGVAVVTATGGVNPYSYIWTDRMGNVIGTESSITNLEADIYCVEVTDANGCVSRECTAVEMATNTFNLADNFDWKISPVPAQNEVQIEIDFALDTDWNWQLLDVNGRILQQQIVNEKRFSVNVASLASGMYFVRLQSDNQLTIRRLMKM
ncbi:MAG: T9SS type A sorting domain-containing protein [Saprospiraceae bacterium]